MREMREPLKIDPSVGFRPPGFLETVRPDGGGAIGVKAVDGREERLGDMILERLLATGVGEAGVSEGGAVAAAAFGGVGGGARADSMASLRKGFVVAWRRASCSSGTVSRFLSMKPSTSYSTSTA
jgi:hypothetical protein